MMKPEIGFPAMTIVRDGPRSCRAVVTDVDNRVVDWRDLAVHENELIVSQTGHVFVKEKIARRRILTPWYRWPLEGILVEYAYTARFCPFLSFGNVYPLLWRTMDIVTDLDICTRQRWTLSSYSVEKSEEASFDGVRLFGGSVLSISRRVREKLKRKIEQRVLLRDFFLFIVECAKASEKKPLLY